MEPKIEKAYWLRYSFVDLWWNQNHGLTLFSSFSLFVTIRLVICVYGILYHSVPKIDGQHQHKHVGTNAQSVIKRGEVLSNCKHIGFN